MPKIELPDLSEIPGLEGIEFPEMPENQEKPDTTLNKMRKEDGAWRIYDIDYQ